MAEARSILGGFCWECYETEALEFDHIDPKTKSFNVSSGRSIRHSVWLLEVHKCQLLCADCHDFKTTVDRGMTATKGRDVHGTATSYRYCRCDICRTAKSEYNTAYLRSRGVPPKRRPEHGEYGMYRKGCRCVPCREANAARGREYRAK